MSICLVLVFVGLANVIIGGKVASDVRSFEIDYEHDQFLKDGKPFRYVSGSLHYFRVPSAYWRDRLKKFRAAGLNAVSTYVEWSLHEQRPGEFDFTGEKDFLHFIRLAEEEGLLVILRPGPYICAERDFGGYPVWLLHENPNMRLRTNDSSHTKHVNRWLSVLLHRIQPLLYGNGGPIIMVQIENEYGSYSACDRNYTLWLRDVFKRYVGNNAVLFTTDGAGSGFLKCGPIPGVFITVDFGSGRNVEQEFGPLRQIQPHGPLVNSEFYPGWLTHWGKPVSGANTSNVVNTTRELLALNASFNFYVFFGGTNFAFTSGANDPPFEPQITSYDYDAPITEAGDLTDKYFAIKSVISEFMPVTDIEVENSAKMKYDTLTLDAKIALFDSKTNTDYHTFMYPQTFESLQLYSGFMLYETTLPEGFTGRGYLRALNIHDRAIVFVNKVPVGLFSRSDSSNSMIISGEPGQSLGLLVENQGHINYGEMLDLKGIIQNVTLNGNILTNWKHTGYRMDDVSQIPNLPPRDKVNVPAFYSKTFQLPDTLDVVFDTFVDMTGWSKGILYVNGHNLGRYWPVKGPQVTSYLPGTFLLKHPQNNTVVLLELERESPSRSIAFVTSPLWI